MSRLDVTYDGQKVGTLAEARGGIFFEYDAQFIATGQTAHFRQHIEIDGAGGFHLLGGVVQIGSYSSGWVMRAKSQ